MKLRLAAAKNLQLHLHGHPSFCVGEVVNMVCWLPHLAKVTWALGSVNHNKFELVCASGIHTHSKGNGVFLHFGALDRTCNIGLLMVML